MNLTHQLGCILLTANRFRLESWLGNGRAGLTDEGYVVRRVRFVFLVTTLIKTRTMTCLKSTVGPARSLGSRRVSWRWMPTLCFLFAAILPSVFASLVVDQSIKAVLCRDTEVGSPPSQLGRATRSPPSRLGRPLRRHPDRRGYATEVEAT